MKYDVCGKEYTKFNRDIIHHIVPVRFGGTNDNENKKCVCFTCHQKIHAYYSFKALSQILKINKNFFNETYTEAKNGIYQG